MTDGLGFKWKSYIKKKKMGLTNQLKKVPTYIFLLSYVNYSSPQESEGQKC